MEKMRGCIRVTVRVTFESPDPPDPHVPANEDFDLYPEVFYGWMRKELPSDFTVLFSHSANELQGIVEEAIAENIIPAWLGEEVTLNDINIRIAEHAYHEKSKPGAQAATLIDDLITAPGTVGDDSADRQTILTAHSNYSGTEDDFWAVLSAQGLSSEKITEIKSTFELSRLSLGNSPLIAQLHLEIWDGNVPKPERIAIKTESEWQTLVTQVGAPTGISDTDYAKHLYQSAEVSYPTTRIAHRVKHEPPTPDTEGLLRPFFEDIANDGFRFEETNIDTLAVDENTAEALREYQRLFRLAPAVGRLDTIRTLRAEGLGSAQALAAMGYGSFIKKFGTQLGGHGAALQVWDEAWHRSVAVQMWTMSRLEDFYGFSVPGAFETLKDDDDEQANWRDLFGSLDFCQCEHCNSVHGPAAYLADLLNWLDKAPKKNNKTPAEVLFELRPDLQHLKLSCQNTNTVQPYIDLANEVMENAVATPADYSVYQTTKTSEELNALPEHIETNRPAYDQLVKEAFPWVLPFDIDREEVWALFEHLGYERHSSRKILRRYAPGVDDQNAAVLDHLGINRVELILITGDDIADPNTAIDITGSQETNYEDILWGIENDADWFQTLQSVSTFLQKATFDIPGTRLDFKTLKQLIVSKTIQAVHGTPNQVEIFFNADEPCDLAKATLVLSGWGADDVGWKALFKVARRFLRLQEKLGWTVQELDKALFALGVDFNSTPMPLSILADLSRIESLRSELKIPLIELLCWWGEIDTAEDVSEEKEADKILSLYEKVFLAPPQEDGSIFLLNGDRTELASPGGAVSAEATAVSGALRIAESDLEILVNYLSTPPLTLATLSRLYALVSLSERLGVTIRQVVSLTGLTGEDPTASGTAPGDAVAFLECVQGIISSRFSVEELDYLFRHKFGEEDGIAPTVAEKSQALTDLQTALGTIETVFELDGITPSDITVNKKKELLTQKVASGLSLASDVTGLLLSEILTGGSSDSCNAQDDLLQAEYGGLWASYFESDDLDYSTGTVQLERVDAPSTSTNSGFKLSWTSPPSFPNNPTPTEFSVRWEGVLRAKTSGAYKFDVDSNDTRALWINGQAIALNKDVVQLRAGAGYSIRLELSKTGGYPTSVELKWHFSDSVGWESVQTKNLFPSVITETYEAAYKSAILVTKLGFGVSDLSYLVENNADFKGFDGASLVGFDFDELPLNSTENAFPLGPWEQVRDVLDFARQFPNSSISVFNILSRAKKELGLGRETLLELTGWEAEDVDRLCNWDTTVFSSAITLVNDLKSAFNSHIQEQPDIHESAGANSITTTDANNAATAKALANEIKTQYEIHRSSTSPLHQNADKNNAVGATLATDLLSLVSLVNELQARFNDHCVANSSLDEAIVILNELRVDYEAHRVLIDQGVHGAPDGANVALVLEAYDRSTAETLANDLRGNYEAHRVLISSVHLGGDDFNPVGAPVANDLASLLTLVRALKTAFEGHRVQVDGNVHGAADIINVIHAPDIGSNDIHLSKDTGNVSTADPSTSVVPDSTADALDVTQEDLLCGRKLTDLYQSMAEIKGLGIRANQFIEWAQNDIDPTLTISVREAIRSKYGPDRWLSVIGTLRNDLRRKQRIALGSYLVNKEAYLKTIDDIYGELLIDAGMEPCMKTSRLKLALSSVQLFVHRCLMNLEQDVELSDDHEKEWRWRKNYRVWEANRKVFLYPENWIEPELRDDKTPFFKELENELLEGEITGSSVEKVYRHYLEKLADVSRLEIVGACEETLLKEKTLHVFGRTRGKPHVYYYRRCVVDLNSETAVEWTPWESVDLDILGDHLLPVIWNRRLHLFWPTFEEKVESKSTKVGNVTETVNTSYMEMKISWSRHGDGAWSPSKTTSTYRFEDTLEHLAYGSDWVLYKKSGYESSYIKLEGQPNLEIAKKRIVFTAFLDSAGRDLTIKCYGLDKKTDPIPNTRVPIVKYVFSAGPQGAGKLSAATGFSLTSPVAFVRVGQNLKTLKPGGTDLWDFNKVLALPSSDYSVVPLSQIPEDMKRLGSRTCFFQDDERSFMALARPWGVGSGAEILGLLAPQFQIFDLYHPHVEDIYGDLNQYGTEGIFDPASTSDAYKRRKQLAFSPASETWFDTTYSPAKSPIIVGDLPLENIDFEENGAFAVYNWELFFHIPMLIAERLKQNQRFADARKWYHYIFDPTYVPADPIAEPVPQRFWRMRHLSETKPELLDDTLKKLNNGDDTLVRCVNKWKKYPFRPHLVAQYRPVSYMKNVVMKYMDNLIAWGDQLFAQDSIESINEATQLYILAAQILGEKPTELPAKEHIPKTFSELKNIGSGLGPFSNVLLRAEQEITWSVPKILLDTSNVTPVIADGTGSQYSTDDVGPRAYPFITTQPIFKAEVVTAADERVLGAYNTVAVTGPSELPANFHFCIPNNTNLLKYWDTVSDRLFKIRNCMNIKGVVRSLPLFQPPIDPAMLVRAVAAGLDISSVLSDATAPFPNYRFSTMVQKSQALCGEVKSFGSALLTALEKKDSEGLSRLSAGHRVKLMNAVREVHKNKEKESTASLQAVERQVQMVEHKKVYYENLVSEDRLDAETSQLENLAAAEKKEVGARTFGLIASFMNYIPNLSIPCGPGIPSISFGGSNLGAAFQNISQYYRAKASALKYKANENDLTARHQRRIQEWNQQVAQAEKELSQLAKQVVAAEIRLVIAQKEKKNQETEFTQAKEHETYLKAKFTDKELYGWMISQLSGLYFQSYKLAYGVARKTQLAFELELGKKKNSTTYIQFGYWDSLKKGLLAGERLSHDINRMDAAYLEENSREYELTKNISLAQINPVALAKLRAEGTCYINFPEELYDFDYPYHCMRRIKTASLSIPCVAGPNSTVACKLELISSEYRTKSDSFESGNIPTCTAMATSNAQNDSGMFEFSFSDQRYFPFEGAGAHSCWKLSLPAFSHFERSTMSDVVFHLRYTAVEGLSRENSLLNNLNSMKVESPTQSAEPEGLMCLLSAKSDFPEQWSLFTSGNPCSMSFDKDTMVPGALREETITVTVEALDVFMDVSGSFSTPTSPDLKMALGTGNASALSQAQLGTSSTYYSTPGATSETSWEFSTADQNVTDDTNDIIVVVHYKAE